MSLHLVLVIGVPALVLVALAAFPLVLKWSASIERRGARK